MGEPKYTLEDWLKNTRVPETEILENGQPDIHVPFYYALSHHSYAGKLRNNRLISVEEYERISNEQHRVYDLLKNARLDAAKARLQEDDENGRITINLLQKKQEELLKQIKELSRYHEMRPTRHIIVHSNTHRDCSLLVDPDLYKLILKDSEDGKPLKKSLVEPEDVVPPDLEESEAVEFYEKFVKSKCYPLPEEIASGLKPSYRELVANHREALMYQLDTEAVSYELQEVSALLKGVKSGEIKTVNGRISRRGVNKKAQKLQMPDEFYEEAKKLYQEAPDDTLSQRGNSNASGWLVDQLDGKYEAFKLVDGKKVTQKASKKTIERNLNKNKGRWQID